MPFDVTNAPIVFVDDMKHPSWIDLWSSLLRTYLSLLVILKNTKTPKNGTQVLNDQQLYAMLSKCEFWLERVQFSRHKNSREGIIVDPAKVGVILN